MPNNRNRQIVKCDSCGKDIDRIVSRLKPGKYHFCDVNCFKNFNFPKKNKASKCIYCKKNVVVPNKADHKDTKCANCHKIWQRLRNKYVWYGKNIDAHILVKWYISQKQQCNICRSKNNLTIDRIIPQKDGGLYEFGNIQILCYKCNCLLKRGFSTIEEATRSPIVKTCNVCGVEKTIDSFHRTSWVAKYIKNSKASFHGTCKECRLKKESKRWSEKHPVPKNTWFVKHSENYKITNH